MRDYQLPIVESALKRQRGVIKSSTGSGKTEVVVKIMVEVACFPAIFYVTSCDLLLQAKDRFSRYVTYNGLPAKIGQIGAGVCDIQPITIATVQSCERVLTGKYTKYTYDDYSSDDKTEFSDPQKNAIREMVKDAKFVVFDECQHCSCETIQSILNESHSARFRFGCSASPWRDDGLDLLIEACFGRRVCDVTASFLINSGYLLKPFITFNHFNQSLGDFGTFNAHYEAFVSDNVARNQWIAERTNYHVLQGRPTIVLVKWVKHAEKLQPMIPGSEILCSSGDSKKSPKKRKEFMDAMRERKLMCIIGTSLMDEGVDVPAAGAGIFAGGGKSSTRELQRVGRFIRPDPADPDKKCAYIEEFYDHSKWLRNHAKLRRKILETESAFEISDNNISLSL
jgi:superfamily II DNA or RNA helicase